MATSFTSPPALAAELAHPHLVLVGLPGSGKSTVGARLARQLGRTFLDFDVEIARRQGMTIAEIFAQRGEASFRELEHALTREMSALEGMVLAPGGGWVVRPETVALLCPPAQLIYLRLSPGAAIRRMGKRIEARPLLQRSNPRGELELLLAARRSAYERADIVIDVESIYPQRVTELLIAQLGVRSANMRGQDTAGG